MRRLRKFVDLSWPDRRLLLAAMLVLGSVTLGLRLLPLLTLQRLLLRLANWRCGFRIAQRPAAQRIAWAIRTAGYALPHATCLPQALAAHFLLIRYGYPAEVQIGAARNKAGIFEAHAWVTGESGIIFGGLADLARFVPFSVLGGDGSLRSDRLH